MTINQARAILKFIIECKIDKIKNEEIVWLLANKFNVEE